MHAACITACMSVPGMRNGLVISASHNPHADTCLPYISCLQVTPPESMTPRCRHSTTTTSLGPGLTEVLVFGGYRERWGDAIAETTILRFGELLELVNMATIVC